MLLCTACVEASEIPAGQETGPCVEGSCFDGLECLSDLCVGPDAEPGDTDPEPSTASGSASSTASSSGQPPSTSSAMETSDSDPDTGDDPETSSTDDGDPPMPWGTCDQLDVLFVVDNSASMLDEQGALAASAPAFLEDLVVRSGSDDHHVMVVDTDAWVFGGCEGLCAFGSCPAWTDFVCGETQPLACEDVLGAGVTHPRGVDASNTDCDYAADRRFVTLSEPDAVQHFACAATVGTGATLDPEVPMEAMVTAVNPVAGGAAAQCNAGFLRADAPLVVVFVTDEDDAEGDSSGTPAGWLQGLAAAKGGTSDRIAVLGLFGDNGEPGAVCEALVDSAGAEPSPRLREFVDLLGDRGVRSSVCAKTYGDAFADLLDVLDSMCQ